MISWNEHVVLRLLLSTTAVFGRYRNLGICHNTEGKCVEKALLIALGKD